MRSKDSSPRSKELTTAYREVEAELQCYHDLFDFVPAGYLATDADGVIRKANRIAAVLLSMSRDYLVGKPLITFIPEENRKDFLALLIRLGRLQEIENCEVSIQPCDGMPFSAILTAAPAHDAGGQLIGLCWLLQDITERKRLEETLRESERQYRDLFENVPTGIYRTTPDGRILMANLALVQMLGYSSFEELTSRNLEKEGFATPYLRAQFRELLEREDEVRGLESQWVRRDGTVIFVRENARAIRGERGDILYYEGTVEDITERKRAEEMLNESEQRYRTLAEHTYDLVIETNLDGRFLYVSPRHKHVLGYMPGELMNRNIFENIHPDDRAAVIAEFQRASRTFNSGHAVFRFKHKNGQWYWLESTGKPYRTATNEIRAVIASRDITERKQSEEQIKIALREKEVLLREIHHRVKNNLQFISSLLILESKYIRNRRAIAVFDEIRNRIRSMAIVHEQLYRSKNLAMIDSVPYIQDLVSNLLYSYNVRSSTIQLKINIDDVSLNIDTAIPVGLIINELVSNSLKHAFPKGRKGEIRINLHSDGGNKFTLIVGDSGVGFPKGFDFSNIESVGLQLVLDLVEQLEGTIGLNTNHGTEFEITFEELKYNERGYDNGKTDPNC